MAKKMYEEASVQALAAALRAQNGLVTTYKIGDMAQAVLDLETELPGLLAGTLTALESKAATIRSYAAYNCGALTSVVLPAATYIGERAFSGCSNLLTVRLGAVQTISYLAFSGAGITSLIIEATGVVTLMSTSALQSTPIASGTGYIYVPDDLVETYKAATNWSTYAAQIKGLSEL